MQVMRAPYGPREISVQRSRGNAESTGNVRDADIRVGEQRFGNVDVMLGHFRWPASCSARPLRCCESGACALPNESPLELRKRAKHVKH